MIHFAYPNINPKPKDKTHSFLGCGRFVASEKSPGDGYENNPPKTHNLDEVIRSADILCPKLLKNQPKIYEKKDKSESYQGTSLNLAYLLARINFAKELKYEKKIDYDIWCTGEIKIHKGGRPCLNSIGLEESFKSKLKAFLSEKNEDKLFIVPENNLNTDACEHLCSDANAHILSLSAIKNPRVLSALNDKTILTVGPNPVDLNKLVNILFKRSYSTRFALIPLIMIVLAAVSYLKFNTISAENIISCIEKGKLSKAVTLINKASPKDGEIQRIKEIINKPVELEIKFEFQIVDHEYNRKYSYNIDSPELKNSILTLQDNYRLSISGSTENVPLYFYIFQRDNYGKIGELFPNLLWDSSINNPVDPHQYTVMFKKWFYLDERSASEKALFSEEYIYIFASPWKADDIENLYNNINKKAFPNNFLRQFRLNKFENQLKKRKDTNFKSFFYKEFSFKHGHGRKSIQEN